MKFTEAPIKGVYLIDLEKRGDERGFFARFFCRQEMAKHGLLTEIEQINNSTSASKGTLRGMHYQLPPDGEVKIVRCVRGALFDVVVDLRPESETFQQSFGYELSAENRTMMYVPVGFAHGFLTLCDDVEAIYLVGNAYSPSLERGLRYNDPALNIKWPFEPVVVSNKDRNHPDFSPELHLPPGGKWHSA